MANPLRWVIWNLRGVVQAAVRTVRNTWGVVCLPARAVRWAARAAWVRIRAGWVLARQVWGWFRGWGVDLFVSSRGWRRWRWAYHAWVNAYVNHDFVDEIINPEVDIETTNWVEDEEEDVAVDYGEELESEGSYWEGFAPEDEDSWWGHDVEDYLEDANEVLFSLLVEEAPYYVRLGLRPVVDVVVRLPVWGMCEGLAIGVVAFKAEWHRWWRARLARPGRTVWVALRWATHTGVWWLVFTGLTGLVTPDGLHLFVTYSCGATFQPEYYFGWGALCFCATVWLVGPHPVREYLYRELGPENVGFVLVGGLVLGEGETYYPQRPMGHLQRGFLARQGYWLYKPVWRNPTEYHYRGNYGSTLRIFTYDDIQQTAALYNEVWEWPETDLLDKEPTSWEPDRSENEDQIFKEDGFETGGENMWWHRHPTYYRNNYMWAEFRDEQEYHHHYMYSIALDFSGSVYPRQNRMYHQHNTYQAGGGRRYPTVTNDAYVLTPPG